MRDSDVQCAVLLHTDTVLVLQLQHPFGQRANGLLAVQPVGLQRAQRRRQNRDRNEDGRPLDLPCSAQGRRLDCVLHPIRNTSTSIAASSSRLLFVPL